MLRSIIRPKHLTAEGDAIARQDAASWGGRRGADRRGVEMVMGASLGPYELHSTRLAVGMAYMTLDLMPTMEMPTMALALGRLECAAERRDVLMAAASLRQVRKLFAATPQTLRKRLEEGQY